MRELKTGLMTPGEIANTHHVAWTAHKEACTEPALYRISDRSKDGWRITRYGCPNCLYIEIVSEPTYKSTKLLGASLEWEIEDAHAAL